MKITKEKVWEMTKRLLIYVIGMFIIAFGVSISIKSNLGVSTNNSVPYVIQQKFPFFTLGTWVTVVFTVFVLIQALILWEDFKWHAILQVPVSLLFGFFVDASNWICAFIIPDVTAYFLCLLYAVISIVLIALGIFLYLEPKLICMPAEGVALALSKRIKRPVSTCKIIFDVFLAVTAATLSLIFFQELRGVREGTILLAVGVGFVMKPIGKFLKKPLHTFIFGKTNE